MSAYNALRLYRVRLRARIAQECLAVLGIAAGVALLFAAEVSSSSLQSSAGQLGRGIEGAATLQLLARGPQGFPEGMLARVRAIPGVRIASPLLETGANAIGPRGSASVQLVGADPSLGRLGGTLVRHISLEPFEGVGAVVLPAPLARGLGVTHFGQEVTLQISGHTVTAPLFRQLRERQIGSLVDIPVVLAPLEYAQEMSGLGGRVTRILVEPRPGAAARVRAAMRSLAGGRLDVEPVSYDETLFSQAAQASNQSTALFAVISALVGFLFAFNATLLTVPQRRRLILDLRRDGYAPRTVIAVLLLDAIALGAVASVLGLGLGEELSIHFLHAEPAFLSLAFAVGSERVVGWESIAIALGGGMLAAVVAVLSPLRDILSRDPLAALRTEQSRVGGAGGRRALAGLGCLAAATALLLAAPQASIPGMVLLIAGLLLELPLALSVALALTRRVAAQMRSVVPHVATMELSAARSRAVAIAATGAVAIFGSVAIEGAHGDLLSGLERAADEMNAGTSVWVAPAGSYNLLQTTPFAPTALSRIARLPGVRAVHVYRGGLLDYGDRRVLVTAPPVDGATPLLAPDQLLHADPGLVERRLRAGGWLVLSQAVAEENDLHVGQAFTLPSPDPRRFRVAAFSTNLGWAPGAIVMNAADYAHAWGSTDASALGVRLAPGVPPAAGAAEIRRALHAAGVTGLAVQTAAQHAARQHALGREALARLTQIAALIPLVAVLAMAAAMGAMVWQRRPRLAKLKLEGIARTALWSTILLESLLLVGVGCLVGAVFGLYGQQLADRALAGVVNFPVVHSVSALGGLESLAVVLATALAILAIPGYVAACVPAALALQD
ncbi:MAG TPA: ABC transporter permease [Solirubrobacteraceae bacterium]|nr:ABC transporter permease [Solirubrobacteraceae bacterium]